MLPQVTELRKPDCFVMRLSSLRTGQRIEVEMAEFWAKSLTALPNEKKLRKHNHFFFFFWPCLESNSEAGALG